MTSWMSKLLSRARWVALLGIGATGVNAALQHDYTPTQVDPVEPIASAPLAMVVPEPKTVAFVTPAETRVAPTPTAEPAEPTSTGETELAELLIEDLWQSEPALSLAETAHFEEATAFDWPTSFVSSKAKVVSLAEQSGY